jgi:hypothetical protein
MRSFVTLIGLVGGAAVAAACGDVQSHGRAPRGTGGSGNGTGSGGSAAVGVLVIPDSGFAASGGAGTTETPLIIVGGASSLDAQGEPVTTEFRAEYQGGGAPNDVAWVVDDTRVGSIGQDGTFTANGLVGGVVTITAMAGSQKATTTVTVNVSILRTETGVSNGDATRLEGGGTADSAFKWLYPYDRTVWPRGLQPPELQFGGEAATALRVAITTAHFDYVGLFGASSPVRVRLPADVWKGVTMSAGPSDWVDVSVTKLSASGVSGPVKESWLVAQGKLKGMLYYNSYTSALANGGGVLRIKLGQDAQPLLSGCTVCHSVSANGNVLTAGIEYGGQPTNGASYRLSGTGTATQMAYTANGPLFAFPALTPDGSLAVTHGPGPNRLGNNTVTQLVNPATAQVIPDPSLTNAIKNGWMPMFSPDGTRLTFVNGDLSYGRHLGLMDVDLSKNPPLFSNYRTPLTVTADVIAWPTFLPDARGIAYHHGNSFTTERANAEVRLLDAQSGTVQDLQALNGYLPDGTFYLPGGVAEDGSVNYEPSASPVAVGGYYWLMFASRRTYGNTIGPGGTVAGGTDGFAKNGPRGKFWMAAIDINYAGKSDPSHPAFYVDGQELTAGNLRPFLVLEPCHPRGDACETGSDCCEGFCRETGRATDGTPTLECVPPPASGCSNLDEPCGTAGDCCNPDHLCLNRRCALAAPPPPPLH